MAGTFLGMKAAASVIGGWTVCLFFLPFLLVYFSWLALTEH